MKAMFRVGVALVSATCAVLSYADGSTVHDRGAAAGVGNWISLLQDIANGTTQNIFGKKLDLSVPSSPALKLLNVDPDKAANITSLQEFAINLINAFDDQGKLKEGFSGIITPNHKFVDLDKLRKSSAAQSWRKSQISFGLVKGSDASDTGTYGALGFAIPMIDRTDWRLSQAAYNDWATIARGYSLQGAIVPNELNPLVADPTQQFNDVFTFLNHDAMHSSIDYQILTLDPALNHLPNPADPRKPLENKVFEDLQAEEAAQTVTGNKVDAIIARAQRLFSDAMSVHDAAMAAEPSAGDTQAILDQKARDRVALKQKKADVVSDFKQLTSDAQDLILTTGEAKLNALAKAFEDRMNKKYWNANKIDAAVALRGAAPNSESRGFTTAGEFAWVGMSGPISANGQYAFLIQYRGNERFNPATEIGAQPSNGFSIGTRLRSGDDHSGWFLEYEYKQSKESGTRTKSGNDFETGYETKVSKDQWLQFSIGNRVSTSHSATLGFGLKLNFNLSPERSLAPESPKTDAGS